MKIMIDEAKSQAEKLIFEAKLQASKINGTADNFELLNSIKQVKMIEPANDT
jgi:hypothetical protein